jgi:hypothetical protein
MHTQRVLSVSHPPSSSRRRLYRRCHPRSRATVTEEKSGGRWAPLQTILDPKYAAPEEYVLPQEAAPDLASHPEPVAMILGANAWVQHAPDRFDMFAVGIIMLQVRTRVNIGGTTTRVPKGHGASAACTYVSRASPMV